MHKIFANVVDQELVIDGRFHNTLTIHTMALLDPGHDMGMM